MAKNEALAAYKTLRDDVVRRLAIVSPDPGAPSPELKALGDRLVAVCDAQAGLTASAPVLHFDALHVVASLSFDDLLHRACLLSQSEWSSIVLPRSLYALATLAAIAG